MVLCKSQNNGKRRVDLMVHLCSLFFYCTLFLLALGTQTHVSGEFTFCTVSGTNLTCNYPPERRYTYDGYAIYRRGFKQKVPERVLSCVWTGASDEPFCKFSEGFRGSLNNNYTVRAQLPSDAFGFYTCSTVPPDPTLEIVPCVFVGKDELPGGYPVNETRQTRNTSSTDKNNSNVERGRDDNTVGYHIAIGVLAAFLVTALIVITVGACWLIMRRCKTKRLSTFLGDVTFYPVPSI